MIPTPTATSPANASPDGRDAIEDARLPQPEADAKNHYDAAGEKQMNESHGQS